MPSHLLHCPIRGRINVPARARDGLTFTEEKQRIDCIRFLLGKGYPQAHFKIETTLLRFGNQGRNSFRTDLAVLDCPAEDAPGDMDQFKQQIKLIAEIKRHNADAVAAKNTQVYPALGFLPDLAALAVYWDDVEQRLFYRTVDGTHTAAHETTMAVLPPWGTTFRPVALANGDLLDTNLLAVFQKLEDVLHSQVTDKGERFEIMLQLLLIKLHDEHAHPRPTDTMAVQDCSDAPLSNAEVLRAFHSGLTEAIKYYRRYLPKAVPAEFSIDGALLRSLSSVLAPVRFLGRRRDVVQNFYMYFVNELYQWNLAQYFTPYEVIDFMVRIVNPRSGDRVKDPACGSGDFLTSAIHYARGNGMDISDAVWGTDNSTKSVQICVLNMVLNGDGKGNIEESDSLETVTAHVDEFSVMLCNPPFGTRIVERRHQVLKEFDLAKRWHPSDTGLVMSKEVLPSQEVGILFAELCVRQAEPGGRIGIIFPNGYLGNGSDKYVALREYLLRNTRVVAVVAFPRFTFKKSGADVSASALILEKREQPLPQATDTEEYPFHVGIIESVGWNVANKKAEQVFRKDPTSGDLLMDDNNDPILDADFGRVLDDLLTSPVPDIFDWMKVDGVGGGDGGWSVPITSVVARHDLSLDPKRWCQRVADVRRHIASGKSFAIGEVLALHPERTRKPTKSGIYRYVQMDDVTDGIAHPQTLRGWELPQRAKHDAEPRDVFVGGIWGSVGKWFLAGGDCHNLIVSNGFYRLQLKPGKEEYLADIIAGLNTEEYRIQARACCTGSDGLAEVSPIDLLEIVLPRVTNKEVRGAVSEHVSALLLGRGSMGWLVETLRDEGKLPEAPVSHRCSNWVQV